jgi:nucleotide-binding universal stress UspA family protein
MLTISKILVPIDFSKRCEAILLYTRLLAKKFQAEITLLHVTNPAMLLPSTGPMEPSAYPFPSITIEDESRRVEAFGVDELAGLPVRRLTCEGTPADQIVAFAQSERVDLIVMPTHGYGLFRRFLIGSVTAKVLHDVACPVFTGAHIEEHAKHPPDSFRTMLCALDLGPHSGKILQWASDLARAFDARLTIVNVIPRMNAGVIAKVAKDWKADLSNFAFQELEKLASSIYLDYASIEILDGDIIKTVCDAAASRHADLLVIGRGSDAHLPGRLKTNAYPLIRQAPCPVISV